VAWPDVEPDVSRPVTVGSDVTPEEWNRFVESQTDATGYHQWNWKRVFEDGLGYRTHYLAVRDEGGLAGVLPLAEVRSPLFGRALSSLPYVNYGGVLGRSAAACDALLDRASTIARERRLQFLVLRHLKRRFPSLPARTHKVTMLLSLETGPDALWTSLDRKVRNQVRKGEKSGLDLVTGGLDLVGEFYTVFARNMRDLGTPVYGRPLFDAMLRQFPSDARIHLVTLKGQTIAGALSYVYRDTIEVPSASSLREHRALCPNHLMYWDIIRQACADGRRVFDFGRSTPGDGTYNFKEQWGAKPAPLYWEYAMLGGAAVPSDDRQGSKFHATIEVWKRLPLGVASLIGPRISRLMP
jgi:FemAB-related protein (PEP-CTERM system-associated)